MKSPARERLRELVTDFYHGLVTAESYLEQRAALLDDIEGFNAAAAETAKPAPAPVKPPADPEPIGDDEETVIVDADAKKGSGGSGLLYAGIAVVAIVGAGAAFLFLGPSDAPDGPADSMPAAEAEAPSVPTQARGETILAQFLEQNRWSRDSLANLSIAWSALDDEQRQIASEGRTWRRMTSRLHQRIREELALDASGSPRLTAMIDLAAALGAPYTESLGGVVADTVDDPLFDPTEVDEPASTPDAGVVPVPEAEVADAVDVMTGGVNDSTGAAEPVAASITEPAEQTPQAPEPQQQSQPDPEPAPAPTAVAAAASNIDDPCPLSLANSRRPYCRDALASGGEGPALVVLSSGSFEMGSDRRPEERPAHSQTVSPIAVSVFEVTVADFQLYCVMSGAPCPDNPWAADDAPVVMVSWEEASAYAAWLSEETGFAYRLPTEAEWEYAARAGTDTPYSFGDEITPSSAHSSVNGPVDAPLPASSRSVNRNPFRLYHMSGNVREWVADAWREDYSVPASMQGSERIVRGGSFADPAIDLRSSARKPLAEDHRDAETGFRVIREVSGTND